MSILNEVDQFMPDNSSKANDVADIVTQIINDCQDGDVQNLDDLISKLYDIPEAAKLMNAYVPEYNEDEL